MGTDLDKAEATTFETMSVDDTMSQSASSRWVSTGMGYKMLAAAMAGLGLVGFVSADFASVWQRIPIEDLPGRQFFAYACAAFELATGVGLLFKPTAAIASRILVVFLLLWALLLKLPAVVAMPQMEATWLGLAEVMVMVVGAWMVALAFGASRGAQQFRFVTGATGLSNARILFALSLLPIGLAHFVYAEQTAAFVPSWLPWHFGWAYLTGAGSIVACSAILSGLFARLAALLEAVMLMIITLLVWTPWLTPASNGLQFQATGFLISLAIASGAWIVSDSYGGWSARSPMKLPANL
jgi:uncharacterized membrane protein